MELLAAALLCLSIAAPLPPPPPSRQVWHGVRLVERGRDCVRDDGRLPALLLGWARRGLALLERPALEKGLGSSAGRDQVVRRVLAIWRQAGCHPLLTALAPPPLASRPTPAPPMHAPPPACRRPHDHLPQDCQLAHLPALPARGGGGAEPRCPRLHLPPALRCGRSAGQVGRRGVGLLGE